MLFQLAIFSNTALSGNAATGLSFNSVIEALLKILFIIGAVMYLVFGFVVVRQIQVMKNTLITPLTPIIQLLGFIHLIFAFGVLILFIVGL